MQTSTQLARHTAVDMQQWGIMREQAQVLVRTGFLPESIKTPEQALAIILKGSEMGLPVMYSLSNIVIIKGKPVAGAEVLQAVIYRDHGDDALRIIRTDAQSCTISYRRRAWKEAQEFTFTIQDAQTAGITTNATWNKYPQAMLRARCISAVARMAFADSIGGMYTPEEMGAAVTVNDEGEIEMSAPAPAATPQDHVATQDPSPPLATQADLDAYEERRDYAETIGLTPPGKLSLNSPRAKWMSRMERVEAMIKDAEDAESPAPPDDFVDAMIVQADRPAELAAV